MKNIIFLVLFIATFPAMAMVPSQDPTAPPSNRAQSEEFPRCHLCGYATTSQAALDAHMAGHASQEHIEGEPRAGGDGPCRGSDEDSATESEDDGCSQAPTLEISGGLGLVALVAHIPEQAPDRTALDEADEAMPRATRLRRLTEHRCDTCSFVTIWRSNLARHKQNVHSGKGAFPCDQCKCSFDNKATLAFHKKMLHGTPAAPDDGSSKAPALEKSGEVSSTEPGRLIPQPTTIAPEPSEADEAMPRATKLRRLTEHRCDKCPFVTAWCSNLSRHKQTVHSDKGSFPCDHCNCSLGSKSALTFHKKMLHSTPPAGSDDESPQSSALETSEEVSSTEPGRLIPQPTTIAPETSEADEAMPRPMKLRRLATRHSVRLDKESFQGNSPSGSQSAQGVIPSPLAATVGWFRCDKCPHITSYKEHLMAHKRTVHSGEGTFKCNPCNSSFHCQASLTRHRKEYHRDAKVPPSLFYCDECPYSTNHKSHLATHKLNVHSGKGTFQCNECTCSVGSQRVLTRHKKIYHGITALPNTQPK